MSSTNDFIAELVRAANEIEKLGDFEKRRLLDRSVTMIRDMRESVGIPPSSIAKDAVIILQTTSAALAVAKAPPERVRAALLDAAGMIRDLHIVLDTKTEIFIEDARR